MTARDLGRRVAALEQAGAEAKPGATVMVYQGLTETLEEALARHFGPMGAPPDANLTIVTLGEA